jgi:cytosine/adenosine deaminase-related metal-dependent hydrolase
MLLTADRIHDGRRFLPEGSVLELDDEGVVVAIHHNAPPGEVIRHEGILCPGFVNAHCHLELSHLKGMLPEHTGLIPFLQKIPSYRLEFTEEQVKAARHEAYRELLNNGVVAVGDISNTDHTRDLRALDQLHIHSFVESIGFTETHADSRFNASLDVYNSFASQKPKDKMLRQSIIPHAPYSVSPSLFRLIDSFDKDSLISIHNQEAIAEDEYYRHKTGPVKDLLSGFNINDDFFECSGESSLQTYGSWLSPSHPMLFVHNACTAREDIRFAQQHFDDTYWCLCPNANLYIQDILPDVNAFLSESAAICIGTDSLASNHQLSILSELQTLKRFFPFLEWETLLTWGTLNGARALGMDTVVGSFEMGKKPGVVGVDLDGVKKIVWKD